MSYNQFIPGLKAGIELDRKVLADLAVTTRLLSGRRRAGKGRARVIQGSRKRLITSASNPTLKLVRKLLAQKRKREELGLFAVEGEDLVDAAAAAGIEPIELLVAGENIEPELLAAVSTRAPGSRRRRLPYAALPREPRETTLALWRVSDPGNIGTLLRAADAFGARSRSPRAAPTRSARKPCERRPARSSGCRCSRSTTLPVSGWRSSRTAPRRCTSSTFPARSPSSSEPRAKGFPRT